MTITRFELMQVASETLLNEPLPEEWHELDEPQQDTFLATEVQDRYADIATDDLYDLIGDITDLFLHFLKGKGIEVEDE